MSSIDGFQKKVFYFHSDFTASISINFTFDDMILDDLIPLPLMNHFAYPSSAAEK